MQQLESLHRQFWNNIVGKNFAQANFTDALNLLFAVEEIIGNKPVKERLNWLWQNTCDEIHQPAPLVELLVFKNLGGAGANKELELGGKTYPLAQLFHYGNNMLKECCQLMTKMTKNYSFDIKYGGDEESGDTNPMFSLGKK